MKYCVLLLLATAGFAQAQEFTRGVGIYPGDPKEYMGPSMEVDASTYRNLALHRPAYQSSAYDYNLTAQLVTDGIKDQDLPQWISTSTSDAGTLSKSDREVFLDGNMASAVTVQGENPWVEFDIESGPVPKLDRIDLYLRKFENGKVKQSGDRIFRVLGSDDHVTSKEVGLAAGPNWPDMNTPGPRFKQSVAFTAPARYRSYRIELSATNVHTWQVAETVLFDHDREVKIAGPYHFTSAWMSAGNDEEWVFVDLGAPCTFDRVTLSWIRRPAAGSIQLSSDAAQWTTIHTLAATAALTDDVHLAQPAHARYVRVLMTRPAQPGNYILNELEIFGRGGPIAKPKAAPAASADGPL